MGPKYLDSECTGNSCGELWYVPSIDVPCHNGSNIRAAPLWTLVTGRVSPFQPKVIVMRPSLVFVNTE